MLSESQVEAFQRDGFVRGEMVLSDAEVEELRGELERVIRDKDDANIPQPLSLMNISGDPERAVWQIVNIWQASDPFRRLIESPRLGKQLFQLIDANELRLFHDQIQYKPAQRGGVNWWHQDTIYWPILQPKDAQLTAWIALDDVDPDNGCMSMAPGSHRWGDQIAYLHKQREDLGPKRFLELAEDHQGRAIEVRPCPVRKGEVHFHHGLTWHGSQANVSGRPRRAIALHYMTDRTRYNAAGEHLVKPFVTVADGEKLVGDYFPLAWSRETVSV